ncbi:MAG: DNA replication protein [Rhodopseudomonas palustris]|uniref:DNA replication protein n=1 Tax=Rhodopseudomonas palustris TaxID=1076 RepID=A0A933S1Q4_RHOPL|nr:DNA replication protein [Rhodopseudomonas palustris]
MKRRDRSARARPDAGKAELDAFRAQHLSLAERAIMTDDGLASVTVDDGESPLAWLARRKGRDGRSLISAHQFVAGERLRADFTRANLTPRVTSNWGAPTGRAGGGGAGEMTDLVVASRQRVQNAIAACGPEFSGVLLDVCCFLRGLEDVERERGWPSRSAKVVLQLALDRLARHYGLAPPSGPARSKLRSWLADGAEFVVG